jgi:hypothetical protein
MPAAMPSDPGELTRLSMPMTTPCQYAAVRSSDCSTRRIMSSGTRCATTLVEVQAPASASPVPPVPPSKLVSPPLPDDAL